MEPVDFGQFTIAVLPLYSPPIRRKRTREKLEQALREFAPFCPDTAAITVGAVAAWMAAHAGRSPIASFSVLRSFAAAVRAGHEELGLVPRNPFRGRPPHRWWPDGELDPPERVRHLPAEQARRLLQRADIRVREAAGRRRWWFALRLAVLVRLYLYTGMRRGEGLGLKREDVDLDGRVISIRPNERRHLKPGASRRRVPLPPPLFSALEEWLRVLAEDPVDPLQPWLIPGATRSGPWFGGPPGRKPLDEVKALGVEAGIPGLTILMLRHTFATIGESLGYGELLLQRLLGHRRRRTQLHYRHEDAGVLVAAGERFRL